MSKITIIEQIKVWCNIYKRILFFKKMYPFSVFIKDVFLLPFDYMFNRNFITTIRNITIAVTHKCNLRCQMCYFYDELKDASELPLSLYKQIIDSVRIKRPCIIFSGGEPFLHPNLIEMVIYAKKFKLPVQIFTNGTLLNQELSNRLIEARVDYINFSLLGNEQSHSDLARNTGAYEKLIENLKYFASHRKDTKVILNFTVTLQGIKDIKHSAELVRSYKLDGLRIQHYNFLLNSEFNAHKIIMQQKFGANSMVHEIEEMSEAISNIPKLLSEFKEYLLLNMSDIPVQWAPALTISEMENWYSQAHFKTRRKCFYPWRGILIDATGKIYPCSKIYLELGNIKNQGVLNSWNSPTMNKFRFHLKKSLFPACARCCKL